MKKFMSFSLLALAASVATVGFTKSASAEVSIETAFIFNTFCRD